MSEELELSGDMFRPAAAPRALVDDPSGPIDLGDLALAVERGGIEEPPPALTDDPSLLWPASSGIHTSLLSVSTETGTAEAWQALALELAEESRLSDDDDVRGAMLCEAGRILIERLGRQEEGELLLRRSQSQLADTLREAGRGSSTRGLAAELAALESTARDDTLEIEHRAAAWIEFGLSCEERTPSRRRAYEAYQRALELVPDHPLALGLAAEAALQLDEGTAAADHLRQLLPHLEAPRQRAAALLDLAELIEPVDERIAVLAQAHAADPADESVLRRYIRALSRTQDRDHLGELYRELARVALDPISASTALHLAFLTLAEAGRPVNDLVLELAARDPERADATDVLAPLSEVALYVEQRIAAGDDARGLPENTAVLDRLWRCLDDPREQALVREQLARLRLAELRAAIGPSFELDGLRGDSARAAVAEQIGADLRFCLVHLPEHRWVREALAEVLRLQGNLPGLVLHLQEWARTQSAGPDRAAILLRLGQLHEQQRRDLARAAEIYELAAAEDPDNPNCLRALGSVYEKMRRWPQAAQSMRRQIDGTADEQDKLTGLRRLAVMAEHELGDIDLAITAFQDITRITPGDLLALYQLAKLSRSARRPTVLVHALEQLAEHIDDDVARTALLVELGEVQELHLKQRNLARACYERALALSPGYAPALRALGRLYRDNGDLLELVRLLAPEVDSVTDPAVLALKAARVFIDEIGDLDGAIERLRTAYRTNPDLVPARELLLQMLTASGQLDEAYDLLRAQEPPRTAAAAADHHYRLGLLAEASARHSGAAPDGDSHRREDAALQHYRAALAQQSDHGLAFERSRRLLVAHDDLPNLVRMIEGTAQAATGQARALAWVQLGRLHLCDAGSLETARRAYEFAFEAAPEDPLVRRELESLLRLLGDRKSLPALYLRSARDTADKHLQATLLVEAAEVLLSTGEHEDHDLAGNAILDALRVDPGNPYAVRHLERLLSEPDSPFVIKDAVSARAVRAQSDAERAIFYVESAELLEKVGAWGQARRAYLAAKGALPHLAPADLGLARLANDSRRTVAATQGRQSIHVLVAEARDAAVRANRGDVAARGRSLALIGEILARDPKHRDAIALARTLAGQLGDATPVVAVLEHAWQRIDEPPLRYELALFLGEHSLSLERAVHYYEAAATAKPTGRRALRGLVHAYRQMGDDRRAAAATERLLEQFDPSEPSAIDLRMGIASFLSGTPETLPRALDHARIVLEARPDDARALQLMADLLDRAGQGVAAAELLERLAARERNRDRLHDILLRRAKLLAAEPDQQAAALDAIERAANLNPGNRETVSLFVDQLERAGQTDRIAAYLGPIRNAVGANIGRGAVSLRDLALLAKVARMVHPALARMAEALVGAIEPTGEVAVEIAGPSPAALRQFIDRADARLALLAEGEPPPLHALLAAIDGAVARLGHEFPSIGPSDLAPMPKGEGGTALLEVARKLAELSQTRAPRLQASSTHNTVIFLQDPLPTVRLGVNLWNLGDELAMRGLVAVAFARLAFGAPRVRGLPPVAIDLLLAASFEISGVFNPLTADPDPRVLGELVGQLRNLLPRRHLKAVEDACKALAGHTFDPGSTARAIRASDLRLATLLTGDAACTLSAACALDGVMGGSLKQRTNRSRSAQDLLAHLIGDDFIAAAVQLGTL